MVSKKNVKCTWFVVRAKLELANTRVWTFKQAKQRSAPLQLYFWLVSPNLTHYYCGDIWLSFPQKSKSGPSQRSPLLIPGVENICREELICIRSVKLMSKRGDASLNISHSLMHAVAAISSRRTLRIRRRTNMFSFKKIRRKKAHFKLAAKFQLRNTLELVFFTSSSALGEPIKNNMNDIAFPHCTHNTSSQAIWFYGLI